MDVSPAPRGACPRVWAPMASGDGLIVRIHAPREGLHAHTMRALVELAREHGNGLIELTRRANLQLRGVGEAGLSQLQTALVRLGLAPAEPAAELRQVLLVNPLSGLDPACAPLEAAAVQIDAALGSLDRELPAKFGILLDSGASLFHELSADIVVDVRSEHAHEAPAERAPAAPQLAHLSVAESGVRVPLGACRLADLQTALQRLIGLLDRKTRMRDLLATRSAAALRAVLEGLLVPASPSPRSVAPVLGLARNSRDGSHGAPYAPPLEARRTEASIGFPRDPRDGARSAPTDEPYAAPPVARRTAPVIGFQRGTRDWFGLAVPFGSGEPRDWLALAQLAEDFGDATLRLSPSRAVLLPGVRAQDAVRLDQRAREHGLITDPDAPLLRAIACPGAPACSSARGETRALARQLAHELLPRLAPGASLHVSGCAKSCASRAPASVTIVCDGDHEKLGFDADAVQVAGSRAIPRAIALQRLKEMAAAGR